MVLNNSWCGTCNLSLLLSGLFPHLLPFLAPAGVSIAGNLAVKKEPQLFFALFVFGLIQSQKSLSFHTLISDPCHGRQAEIRQHPNQRIRERFVQEASRSDHPGSGKRRRDTKIRDAAGKTGSRPRTEMSIYVHKMCFGIIRRLFSLVLRS